VLGNYSPRGSGVECVTYITHMCVFCWLLAFPEISLNISLRYGRFSRLISADLKIAPRRTP
jgi:hypothetical protein